EFFSGGPYPLRKEEGFTYTIDFENSGKTSDDWHDEPEVFLRDTGILEHNETYSDDDQSPLTTFTYASGDDISTHFASQNITFLRVGRDLVAGKYVYEELVAPYLTLTYEIFARAVAGVKVKCG
ncbi:hypothetical protein FOZ62_018674, partial [Perkinsus olseni]